MVSLPGQPPQDNFLRHSPLRLPLDTQRKGIRLKDRYLVIRHNDVRDAGGIEPFQNNKVGGAHQNREG